MAYWQQGGRIALGRMKEAVSNALTALVDQKTAIALILFLVVFHGVNNYVVMQKDTVFFTSQSGSMYMGAASLTREFGRISLRGCLKLLTWHYANLYPVVYPGFSAMFLSLFGFSQDNAVMSNLVWLGILLTAVYAITSTLFNRKSALMSVLILSFLPGIVAASRGFTKDLALAAMIAASLAFLLISQGLEHRLPALLFGLTLGLTALTYPSFILFVIGPLIVGAFVPVVKACRDSGIAASKNRLVNLLFAAIIVFLLASPWYVTHALDFLGVQMNEVDPPEGLHRPIGWALQRHFPQPLFAVLTISLILFFFDARGRAFLLGWILLPLVFYTLLDLNASYHILRYILPVIPAGAILLSRFLQKILEFFNGESLRQTGFFFSILVVLLIVGMSFTLLLSHVWKRDLTGQVGDHQLVEPSLLNKGTRLSPVIIAADIKSAVVTLEDEFLEHEGMSEVFVMNPFGYISDMLLSELEVRQMLGKRHHFLSSCIEQENSYLGWAGEERCIDRIISADYLVIEGVGGSYWTENEIQNWPLSPSYHYIAQNLDYFEVILELPNNDLEPYFDIPAADFVNGTTLILKQKDISPLDEDL